jgi:hypothetical protein
MPSVVTKTCGILKIRNTLSSSVCLVVKPSSMTKDTQALTRVTNNSAPNKPGRVIINFIPANLKLKRGSPGVTPENNAGMAIKREKMGINTQVLIKKNLKLILEKDANKIQNKYEHNKSGMFFIRSADIIKSAKVTAFTRGSMDCKNPFFKAYSSAKTDSLKKERAPRIERSIKLFLFNAKLIAFFG